MDPSAAAVRVWVSFVRYAVYPIAPSCAKILTVAHSEVAIVSVVPVLIAVAVVTNRYLPPELSGAVCDHPSRYGLTVLPALDVPNSIPEENV